MTFLKDAGMALLGGWIIGVVFGWFKLPAPVPPLMGLIGAAGVLNWTIVRPGAFVDGNLTGEYRHGFSGKDKTTKLKISRADVADFILKQLTDDSSFHKTLGISY
jgi:XapX domain-containing protein